jgi:hypothetical protein
MSKEKVQVGDVFATNQGYAVKVVYIGNKSKFLVQFCDYRKHQCLVSYDDLEVGNVENPYHRSCYEWGYIGDGDFRIKRNPNDKYETLEFTVWCDFLNKQSNDTENYPINHEWLNFQVFAEWYTSYEHYGLGYELDSNMQWRASNEK